MKWVKEAMEGSGYEEHRLFEKKMTSEMILSNQYRKGRVRSQQTTG